MIEIKNISFAYPGEEKLIKNFNLNVPEKSIYGFLGQNGAGKTTIIRLILSLLKSSSGEILINNEPLTRNKVGVLSKIGTLIEEPSLYEHLTGRENLELMCVYYKTEKKNINEALKKLNLLEAANKKVKNYSLGMKQRLGIASSLIHDPEILILDEPMNGLDPQGIAEIRNLFIDLNQNEGKTIFYSSHILSEIENTCTDIGVIDAGKNIFTGTIQELRKKMNSEITYEIESDDIEKAQKIIQAKYKTATESNGNSFSIGIENKEAITHIIEDLVKHDIKLFEVKKIENSLEKLFLQLINKK